MINSRLTQSDHHFPPLQRQQMAFFQMYGSYMSRVKILAPTQWGVLRVPHCDTPSGTCTCTEAQNIHQQQQQIARPCGQCEGVDSAKRRGPNFVSTMLRDFAGLPWLASQILRSLCCRTFAFTMLRDFAGLPLWHRKQEANKGGRLGCAFVMT